LTIIAIDPGKSGGIAYALDGREIHSRSMPDTPGDILDFIRTIKAINGPEIECYMESCVKYAGKAQSGSASIVYGRNYGFLEGVIQALGIRLHSVSPQKWIKALGLGTRGGSTNTQWKNKLKAEAQRLFPSEKVTLKTADALLILEYAKQKGTK